MLISHTSLLQSQSNPMRIGFFTDSYYPSRDGIAVSVETFRAELEKLGHQVYIFGPKPAEEVEEPSPRIKRFAASPSLWFDEYRDSWPINPRVMRQIRQLKLDIIHTHTQFQIGLLGTYFAKANNIPLVTTCHADFEAYVELYRRFMPALFFMNVMVPIATKDAPTWKEGMNLLQPEKSITKWNRKLSRQIVKHYSNQCDQVVSPSEKIKHMLIDLGVTSDIAVIQTGVDASLFQPVDPFLRDTYHLQNKTVLLYVGRVRPEKNIELLIRAYALIKDSYPDLWLVIAGSGKHAEVLKQLVAEMKLEDRTVFTGGLTRDQVYAVMKEGDIFAFPSVTETQGLVVDEAVLSGLPVVMVDHEVSEVTRAGENALFATNDPADYAAKIEMLVKDRGLRQQYSQASNKINEEFSALHQAQKLEDCYIKLLEKPKNEIKRLSE